MKKIVQVLKELPDFFKSSLEILFSNYKIEEMLFFDIETTGFSAKVSSLYLIGACYYDKMQKTFLLIQYFAEEFNEEEKLLKEFYQFSQKFSVFLHYNGRSFDLPYLNAKCEFFKLPFRFCKETKDIDIYQIFHKDKLFFDKKIFPLKNKKQRTIEELAGYHRKENMDGKELISVYLNYHKAYIMEQKEEEERLLAKILLHNYDDLCGLIFICPFIGYIRLMEGTFSYFSLKKCEWIKDRKNNDTKCELYLELETKFTFLPISIYEIPYGKISGHQFFLRIPGKFMECKFFYKDYQNYYYLPEEDMAIHKSIAAFVDKTRKKKARPENCYIKKRGWFFPQPINSLQIQPVFYEEYRGLAYFEWEEKWRKNSDILIKYALGMIAEKPMIKNVDGKGS